MTAKRLLALVGAFVLIIGALLLRSALNDQDKETASTDGTGNDGGSTYSIVCSTEFATVCNALGPKYSVMVEAAGTTLDRLAKTPVADLPDAWITLDPFPAMLDETRTRSTPNLPAASTAITTIAVTDPAFTMSAKRAEALAAACTSIAKCIGDAAGSDGANIGGVDVWGTVRPSLTDPYAEASGLLALANIVAGHFGAQDDLASTPWLDDPPPFSKFLREFHDNVVQAAPGTTPLTTLLVRSSLLDIAATSTAEAATVIPTVNKSFYGTLTPKPAITLRADIATFTKGNDSLRDALSTALVAAGWGPAAADLVPLPQSTFIALRTQWKEAK